MHEAYENITPYGIARCLGHYKIADRIARRFTQENLCKEIFGISSIASRNVNPQRIHRAMF